MPGIPNPPPRRPPLEGWSLLDWSTEGLTARTQGESFSTCWASSSVHSGTALSFHACSPAANKSTGTGTRIRAHFWNIGYSTSDIPNVGRADFVTAPKGLDFRHSQPIRALRRTDHGFWNQLDAQSFDQ